MGFLRLFGVVLAVLLVSAIAISKALEIDEDLFEEGVPAIYYKRKHNNSLTARSLLVTNVLKRFTSLSDAEANSQSSANYHKDERVDVDSADWHRKYSSSDDDDYSTNARRRKNLRNSASKNRYLGRSDSNERFDDTERHRERSNRGNDHSTSASRHKNTVKNFRNSETLNQQLEELSRGERNDEPKRARKIHRQYSEENDEQPASASQQKDAEKSHERVFGAFENTRHRTRFSRLPKVYPIASNEDDGTEQNSEATARHQSNRNQRIREPSVILSERVLDNVDYTSKTIEEVGNGAENVDEQKLAVDSDSRRADQLKGGKSWQNKEEKHQNAALRRSQSAGDCENGRCRSEETSLARNDSEATNNTLNELTKEDDTVHQCGVCNCSTLPEQRNFVGACLISSQCIANNSQCGREGFCEPAAGWMYPDYITSETLRNLRNNTSLNEQQQQYYPAAWLGDDCSQDNQCQAMVPKFSECSSTVQQGGRKICACKRGYVRTSPTTCIETIDDLYATTCFNSLQCTQKYSTCATPANFNVNNGTQAAAVGPQCICDFAYQFAYPSTDRKSCCSYQDYPNVLSGCPETNDTVVPRGAEIAFANYRLIFNHAVEVVVHPKQQASSTNGNTKRASNVSHHAGKNSSVY